MFLDAYKPNSPNSELSGKERNDIKNIFRLKEGTLVLASQPVLSVYYDAWKYDNDGDPVLSLIYEIAIAMGNEKALTKTETALGKAFLAAVKSFAKIDLVGIAESRRTKDILEGIVSKRKRDSIIRDFLRACLPENGNRLVVFVDELDRCNPAFAVSLLERVKHYFNELDVFFVFAINSAELQHTINRFYGDKFDSTKYLNRFFLLKCSLPPVERFNYIQSEFGRATQLVDLVFYRFSEEYGLSLRDVGRLCSSLNGIKKYIDDSQTLVRDSLGVQFLQKTMLPIMVGLQLYNREAYEAFISGNDGSAYSTILMHSDFLPLLKAFRKDRKELTEKEILDLIYDTIFKTKNIKKEKRLLIAGYEFNSGMKVTMLEQVSQLKDPWKR